MIDDHDTRDQGETGKSLEKKIEREIERRVRSERERDRSVWFGLGMFGLVGWSIAIPTLAGIALGMYIDSHYPSRFSWTLMLLFAGVVIGCLNAWYWVQQERRGD